MRGALQVARDTKQRKFHSTPKNNSVARDRGTVNRKKCEDSLMTNRDI
jgi:hypothetical protein